MGVRGERDFKFSSCWAISTLLFFSLMVTWSFATPLGAAADEPAHIVKAAAVARGEFLGHPTVGETQTHLGYGGQAVMTVLVPATYAETARLASCYRHHPKRTAKCAPAPLTSDRLIATTTYVGRYPPLYYVIVGSPTRYWHSGAGIYLMRVLSSLASALLIGLALAASATWSRSRFLKGGIALAATPMAVFFGSVVNPSGLEIAASIAAWTTGLVLVMDHSSEPPPRLLVAFAASSCILVLTRGLSPLWSILIAMALLALEPRGCLRLMRDRAARIAAAVIAITGLVAAAYTVLAGALAITPTGTPLSKHATILSVASIYGSHSSAYITQIVGDFGWLDTPAPFLVVFLIGVAICGLVWLAVVTSKRHHMVVLVGVVVASILVPMAIDIKNALQIHNDVWQSRYALPLYVGVPLVAAAIAGRSRVLRSSQIGLLIITAASLVAACQFVCFFTALHRYSVGINGGLNPLAHVVGGWTPPIPTTVLLALAAVFTASYGWWIVRLDRPPSSDQTDLSVGIGSVQRHPLKHSPPTAAVPAGPETA